MFGGDMRGFKVKIRWPYEWVLAKSERGSSHDLLLKLGDWMKSCLKFGKSEGVSDTLGRPHPHPLGTAM